MNVRSPVDPGPPPRRVVDKHRVPTPVHPAESPAPGPEESADGYAESKPDRSADHKTGPRREEHDRRIVPRHHHEPGVHRHDGDVRSAAHDNLAVTPQIPEVPGPGPLPLDGVYHVLLLRQKCVADVPGPVDIGG